MRKVLTIALLVVGIITMMAQQAEQFSVATLNVDGLPKKILVFKVNDDGPGDAGTARIGKYLLQKQYDMMFMQEDFNYHELLKVFLEDDYSFDTWSGDVELDGHTIDFLHLQNHRFECDGLMTCWKKELTVTPVYRKTWTQNFGKFSHAWDEMVTKGFRRYEVTLKNGTRLVCYNMHMDASDDADVQEGNDGKDKEARMAQWIQLKEDIMIQLDTRPVIILGDMNSLYGYDTVKQQFIDAINETGRASVADVWVEISQKGTFPTTKESSQNSGESFDKILYINPTTGTQIKPVAFMMDIDGYKYEGNALGDHYPVSATFEVVNDPTGITGSTSISTGDKSTYYSLDGRQVTEPVKGGVYIERQDGQTSKRIIK